VIIFVKIVIRNMEAKRLALQLRKSNFNFMQDVGKPSWSSSLGLIFARKTVYVDCKVGFFGSYKAFGAREYYESCK